MRWAGSEQATGGAATLDQTRHRTQHSGGQAPAPETAEKRARIRRATRAGKSAAKTRQQAEGRLADALRRLIAEDLSIRESAERVGVAYHAARSLIRAADVADAVWDEIVGGQT